MLAPLSRAKVITIILLHPQHSTPIQSWSFKNESIIRIGRAIDNHVVLYSAVVSRHHAELRQLNNGWEIISLGANGTFIEDRRLTESVSVDDGVILRLAKSGPTVQIRFDTVSWQQGDEMTTERV